ncbi:MAG: glycosyl hydrolase 53 family protein [Candidatus Neomarinimicrobiota bacterium]
MQRHSRSYSSRLAVAVFILGWLPGIVHGVDSLNFIVGADVSYLKQIEDYEGTYTDDGLAQDALEIFRLHGFNYIRLKIWHTPAEPYNNLEKVRIIAGRAKELGFKFLLNFHYSDFWADPGKQYKPKAWKDLPSFEMLEDSLYQYTNHTIMALKSADVLPDMVQLGNEINCGMLWPEGHVCGSDNTSLQWYQLASLINAGIRAVRDSLGPDNTVKIMIHHASGGDNGAVRWFFDNLFRQGVDSVDIDIIGLSFYPKWHGTLDDLRANLYDLANRYYQDLIVVETGYPWTLASKDVIGNIYGSLQDLHSGYPATVAGQRAFLLDLGQIVRNVPNGQGKGIFYWEPEWISVPELGSAWENVTLFDFDGETLESIDALALDPSQIPRMNVTIRLNTAANYDTLYPHHVAQIRGEITGCGGGYLSDGRRVSWGADSDLLLQNTGGDYWTITLPMCSGDELSFKFWSGLNRQTGTFLRLGWEGPVTPYDDPAGNTRIVVVGESDTTLPIQFYNSTGESVTQYWRPYPVYDDSVAIFYRVNLGRLMDSGLFEPDVHGPVGVRGDPPLSWDETRLLLTREVNSVNGGSFWSGVFYIPHDALGDGFQQEYKFHIENADSDGLEEGANRVLSIRPDFEATDTTLHWVYFTQKQPVAIQDDARLAPVEYSLMPVYPNPFNTSTVVTYQIPDRSYLAISVYDLQGRLVRQLDSGIKEPGTHTLSWNGEDSNGVGVASGVYYLVLKTGGSSFTRKMVLLR